ncbi:phage tail protein [Paenibacillus alvei]|uniref:phage tail protein n=1 Tax=Paenibacillus alvei TaxID=44250 RepID=UPI0013D9E444|nr:phage tail protein [Paenibacillus alvei]NEZ43724.1 oxidoreductase [Paenibacillus alvei]
MIGAFGEVNFLVSSEKIRTFDDFQRSCTGRWAEHEVMGKKPKLQYIGPGLDTIRFKMRFDYSFGLKVRYELDRLVKLHREGKPHTLTIGKKALGVYKWVIMSLDEEWITVDHRGNVLVAEVDVELKEYVK